MGENEDGKERPRAAAYALYAVVFICGAVFMCLEIAGSRVVAPFLGSSIFVWGSLIGVIMVALSAGYYVGGRLVDRYPSFDLLMALVAAGGVVILFIPGLSRPVLSWISGAQFGPKLDPLLATLILFVLPSLLLATVSPFAVRLCAREVTAMGNVAGRLYALSTFGSIVGTLGTAFFLIPAMGTRVLVYSLGAALIVLAAAALVVYKKSLGQPLLGSKKVAAGLALAAAAGLLTGWPAGPGVELSRKWERELGEAHTLITHIASPYHLIIVTEQEHTTPQGEKRRRRLLRFNDRIESAIYVDRMDENGDEPIEFESAVSYTSLLHCGLVFHPEPRRILFVGCGGGVAPTEFTRGYGVEADVVEIDEHVVKVAEEYFYMKRGKDLRVHIMDGRRFIESTDEKWDMIVLDAYTSGGRIPFHLITREFFELVRSRLTDDGIMISNLISPVQGEKAGLYRAVYMTQRAAGFSQVYTFPKFLSDQEKARYKSSTTRDQYKRPINIIMVATRHEKRLTREEIYRLAAGLANRDERPVTVKDFMRHVKNVRPAEDLADRAFRDAPLLTDDYAPVDALYAEY